MNSFLLLAILIHESFRSSTRYGKGVTINRINGRNSVNCSQRGNIRSFKVLAAGGINNLLSLHAQHEAIRTQFDSHNSLVGPGQFFLYPAVPIICRDIGTEAIGTFTPHKINRAIRKNCTGFNRKIVANRNFVACCSGIRLCL